MINVSKGFMSNWARVASTDTFVSLIIPGVRVKIKPQSVVLEKRVANSGRRATKGQWVRLVAMLHPTTASEWTQLGEEFLAFCSKLKTFSSEKTFKVADVIDFKGNLNTHYKQI